jgi:hypothetical protein
MYTCALAGSLALVLTYWKGLPFISDHVTSSPAVLLSKGTPLIAQVTWVGCQVMVYVSQVFPL